MYVGAQVDVFGKMTVLKQCDLKTAEWNKFYASFLTEVSSESFQLQELTLILNCGR